MELSNGRKIVVDLTKITISEWRLMWSMESDETKSDEILGRCTGMSVEQVQALLLRDYQALCKAVREEAAAPLADPNSPSASTED